MTKKGWLTLIGFIVMMALILFGGPWLSSMFDKNYRKNIDRNGAVIKAVVYNKRTHKGNTVHFRYEYKGGTFTNHEQSDKLFEELRINDTIEIRIDTTRPGYSYVVQ